MNIKIVCVGKLKETYWTQAVGEYAKRLSAYCTLLFEEVKESATDSVEEEGRALLKKIRKDDYVIALAMDGESLSSEKMAEKLAGLALSGRSHVVFVIGGSEGLAAEVILRAEEKWSFSAMTFPHQMMRVILAEQIYRSFKIMRKETYHK